MRIGIVTTWFERGASYVSKIYMDLLESEGHDVYIFARGGEKHESQKSEEWNQSYVTRSIRYSDTRIERRKMKEWLVFNKIECVFFNEQADFSALTWIKKFFPSIKIGGYVDYYTENTIPFFQIYDFLICNTHRHMMAMKDHPQKYYVEWGTNIDIFKPIENKSEPCNKIKFFHSAGMSTRKGTDILIKTFLEYGLNKDSILIVHAQLPIEQICGYKYKELEKAGVVYIEKTVPAPGLYSMGDVYVYPSKLDGLGLTMYEALACGLPLITSDFPPMNEVGNNEIVRRVKIHDFYCRGDAYYYPMCVCDKKDLAKQMMWFIENKSLLNTIKNKSREFAIKHYDIRKRAKIVSDIFVNSKILPTNNELVSEINNKFDRRIRIANKLFYILFGK